MSNLKKTLTWSKPFRNNPSNGDDLLRRLAHNLFHQDGGQLLFKSKYNYYPGFYGDNSNWKKRFDQLRPRLTAVPDDVAQHVLEHLGAHDVTRLALTSSIWRRHVRRRRLHRAPPPPPPLSPPPI